MRAPAWFREAFVPATVTGFVSGALLGFFVATPVFGDLEAEFNREELRRAETRALCLGGNAYACRLYEVERGL